MKRSPLEYVGVAISVISLVVTIVQFATKEDRPSAATTINPFTSMNDMRMKTASQDSACILDEESLRFPWPAEGSLLGLPKDDALAQLQKKYEGLEAIILSSDDAYDGVDAWDAMQSIGLKRHTDDQYFHWESTRTPRESYFFVATSTYPYHFKYNHVLYGKMNPRDLVFIFKLPLVPDPENTNHNMYQAALYCQRRLGGTLLNEELQPYDFRKAQRTIKKQVKKLKADGIVPGTERAKAIFSVGHSDESAYVVEDLDTDRPRN